MEPSLFLPFLSIFWLHAFPRSVHIAVVYQEPAVFVLLSLILEEILTSWILDVWIKINHGHIATLDLTGNFCFLWVKLILELNYFLLMIPLNNHHLDQDVKHFYYIRKFFPAALATHQG